MDGRPEKCRRSVREEWGELAGSIKNGYEPFRVINSKERPSIEPSIEPSLLNAVTHSVWPSVIIATSSTSIPGEMNRK